MSYAEYLPHPDLRKYIEAYWTLTLDDKDGPVTSRILPDGCTDIIFNRDNESHLVGTMTSYRDTISNPGSSILGIRFRPGGMIVFYALNQQELTDLVVPYQDKKLAELIARDEDLLNRINQYFLEKLPLRPLVLSAIIDDIYIARGKVRIPELTLKYNMSERKLERLFKKDVGVTIKGLTKLVRFTHTLGLIRNGSNQASLTNVALEAGYYDQAHLCNEIKAYTGLTPAQL